MDKLELLLQELHFRNYKGNDTLELFLKFYENNCIKIKCWLCKIFENECSTKNNAVSDRIRKEGNEFYVKGLWSKSLQYYTEAISKASDGSESYSVALANRSAALYSLKEYKYALQDIKRCLFNNYPDKLKCKLYIRKISCYYKIGNKNKAKNSLEEGLVFIENNTTFTEQEKDHYKNRLLNIGNILPDNILVTNKNEYNIPEMIENKQFHGASSLVDLRYTTEKGRYVVAKANINSGDILFIEKAFSHAPVFNENSKLSVEKCYYCLMNNKALIPCKYCSLCLYCSESCQINSWNENHKWECKGMCVNFWSSIGLAFPAFRVLLKGIPEINITNANNYTINICNSGNYKYVYQLISNILESKSQLEFLALATVVLTYLDTQTCFFKWLSNQMNMKNDKNLRVVFGSLLLKHVAQIACNASVIEHWDLNNYKYIPTKKVPIATGLYPSVSMMNHSCKANVALYYINDIVIVKAIESIKRNEEVFNCYGVDYRYISKQERKSALEMQYQFQCFCRICGNPNLEIDYLNTFKCPYCTGIVLEQKHICIECGMCIDIAKILQLEDMARQYLRKELLSLEGIHKSYNVMKAIYSSYHISFTECFDAYTTYYLQTEMFDLATKYFKKSLEIKTKHWSENSVNIAKEIIKFLDNLSAHHMKCKKKLFPENIKDLYQQAVNILPLYYPNYFIDFTKLKPLIQ